MKYVSKDYGLIDFESWYYPYPSSSRLWVDTLLDWGMCQTIEELVEDEYFDKRPPTEEEMNAFFLSVNKEMLEYIDELETYNKECHEEPRGLPW